MTKLTKNLTLTVALEKRSVVAQPAGVLPALKAVTQEVGQLQVAVCAHKCLGASRLEPLHDRYEVSIKEVFEVLDGGTRAVTQLLENIGYLETLHDKLLPLVAEEFEGKTEEVAA